MKSSELGRKSTLAVMSLLVQQVLGLIGFLFISWYMFPSQYGTVQFAIAFVGMFSFIGDMGFSQTHLKKAAEPDRDLGRAIGAFITFKVLYTFILVGAILGSVLVWTHVLGKGFETPDHVRVIYIITLFSVFNNLMGIPLLTFQARMHIAKMQMAVLAGVAVQTAFTIYVAFVSKSTTQLAWTYAIGLGVQFAAGMVMLSSYPIKKPLRADLKEYFGFALPLIFAGALSYAANNLDKVLLQLFGGAGMVGYYTLSYKWPAIALSLSIAMSTIILPHLSSLHARKDVSSMCRFNLEAERYISLISVPLMAYLIVMAVPFISVIGQGRYDEGAKVLPLLAVQTFLWSVSIPWASALTGASRPELHIRINAVYLSIVLGLCILLIPTSFLGIPGAGLWLVGAGVASAAGMAAYTVVLRLYCNRVLGAWGNRRMMLHIAAGAGMGAVLYLMTLVVDVSRWFELIMFGLAGLGVYVAVLFAMRELTMTDVQFFLNMAHPGRMAGYVRSEMKDRSHQQDGKSCDGKKEGPR